MHDYVLSCEILLSEVLGLSRIDLYSHFSDYVDPKITKKFISYIKRRAKSEPIQYILGYAHFRGLKIFLDSEVLIPRPETELLVEFAIKNLGNNCNKILDLCTGSGCISCALANEFSNLQIVATDISKKAIECALKNVKSYNFDDKINLLQCDMDDDVVDVDFDLVICNPPYIPSKIYELLDKEIYDYEPKLALEAGEYGIDFLNRIIGIAKSRLKNSGIVALEFYESNLELAKQEFENAGFKNCKIYKDFAGKDRVLIAAKS